MQGWEGKLLSQAGREILVKAVAQAPPTYSMSCFKLPMGLCQDIEALIKRFFGAKRVIAEKYTGLDGRSCANPKARGDGF